MKIGWIQSFEKEDTWYLISRHGKAVRDGGEGVEWICGCPYGRRTQPCEHLLYIFSNSIELPRKDNFKFLTEGKRFYKKFYQGKLDKIAFLMACLDESKE